MWAKWLLGLLPRQARRSKYILESCKPAVGLALELASSQRRPCAPCIVRAVSNASEPSISDGKKVHIRIIKEGSWLCAVEAETGGHSLSTVFIQSCVTYNIGIVDSSFIPRRQWRTNLNYHAGTVMIDHLSRQVVAGSSSPSYAPTSGIALAAWNQQWDDACSRYGRHRLDVVRSV